MKNDVYQIVTDRIIRLLEAGTVPWHRPWKGGNHWPQNFITRKVYRGINLFLLNAASYPSPYWLTFKQVQALGGYVKNGEQSFPVVFWKMFREEDDAEERRIPFLRYHRVFNVAQCEGINAPSTEASDPSVKFQPIEKCEQIVSAMPKRPEIKHGGPRACYSPSLDTVTMPEARLFESSEEYYSTLYHELTHATGHVSRLNRKEITNPVRFGSDPYSREELVAEMGAAFLCGHCAIEHQTIDQSVSYIQSWLAKLKADRKLVVQAAAQAQKACDFILNIAPTEESEPVIPQAKEYKVVALRDCPLPETMQLCDTPDQVADYWRLNIATHPYFNPDCECLVVLLLNTRKRVRGHHLVTIGTMDTLLVHAREIFSVAVSLKAASLVLIHNHPSGDPTPSEADIKVTRELIRAGLLLKIEVVDHVIMGRPNYASLRSLGYFAGVA